MNDTNLFFAPDGHWITRSQFISALEQVRATDARILYIHTGMTFGAPNPALVRQELLSCLFDVLRSLRIPTLCFPTFTFSFCNGEEYCVQTSRSRMGALNEYVRKLPDAIRSVDPLMSSALIGEDADLVQNLGKNSIGENSTFDKLHRRAGVKFLFFGTTVSECFTYTHYVEERLRSSYRYDRRFSGRISDGGRTWEDEYTLFVRYQGAVPNTNGMLEADLLRRGMLRKTHCGGSSIACVSEADGYEAIDSHLRHHPNCYVVWNPDERNTHFVAHKMVAL